MEQGSSNLDAAAHPGLYRFGDVEVDVAAHTLKRGGQPCAIEPKAFAVLLALLRRPGELLGHDELLDGVWGHRHVTPGVLTRAIAQLRGVLGDDPHHPRYIQTRHALGYCFVGELQAVEKESAGQRQLEPPALPFTTPVTDSMSGGDALVPEASAPPEGASGRRVPLRRWLLLLPLAAVIVMLVLWSGQRDPPPVSDASVAVLPFTTLAGDQNERYFAEGLSAEMLSALSGLPGLKVAAWRPPEAVDRSLDVKALGKLLGVATVLDANVKRDAGRLRINAMLSDTTSGYTLWSKVYDRDIHEVFDTQSEIAREVATVLLGNLADDGERLARRLTPTHNVQAFDSYLKGVAGTLRSRGSMTREEAAAHFRAALAADSKFARAQAALCRTELWKFESQRNTDAFDRARIACQKAADMDGSIGEVDLALGDLYRISGDRMRATRYYGKLFDAPDLAAEAHMGLAQVLVDQGEDEKAMDEFRLALEARPGNAKIYAELGYQQFRLGRYVDAIDSYRKAVALRPDVASYWSTLGALLVNAGDPVEAGVALRRAVALSPDANSYANLGELEFRSGKLDESVRMYRKAIELDPEFFLLHGYLADVLAADAQTEGQARFVYADAARLAGNFLEKKPDDALATAAFGWYLANLGEHAAARTMAAEAESLELEPGEVAFLNAQTFALLGDTGEARSRLARSRELEISESRIASSPVLQRAGLVDPGQQHRAQNQPDQQGSPAK